MARQDSSLDGLVPGDHAIMAIYDN